MTATPDAVPYAAATHTTATAPTISAERRVVPRRHWVRWILSSVVILLAISLALNIAQNETYQWSVFPHYFVRPLILKGVVLTLQVSLYAGLVGLVLGTALALARLSGSAVLSGAAWLYIWFFRSLPVPVLLLIIYNVSHFFPTLALKLPLLPALVSHDTPLLLPGLVAAVVGLALNEAAYAAELIRGGILAVDHGQIEAANALGLSPARRLTRVVLPQALRSIVPGYVNQLVGLVKMSSLVYFVGLADVFGAVYILESRIPNDIVPLLLVGSAWYLVITTVLSILQFYVERHYARGAVRTLPPTPFQRLRSRTAVLALRLKEARA
ncbi:amino acid ABC transporter permease [Nocardioides sp. Kera G14]|uniref:amino acid ABC transporter permease n=1 Tax=Nocardioides sp. Kera G14 TaxID=2884264 RepID=UPI001D11F47F|nr:amino acid ABC transporter permease [Nocardioides sp. Kera G14]UDY24388.1 amino acid ABC transporter permease [Nocardioides sp. Kera G14]